MEHWFKQSIDLRHRHSWTEALGFFLVALVALLIVEFILSMSFEILIGANAAMVETLDDIFGICMVASCVILVFRAKGVLSSSRIFLTIAGIALALMSVPVIGLSFCALMTMLNPRDSAI